jgi:hypothetical protein
MTASPPPTNRPTAERVAAQWVLGLLGLQIACQVALLFEELAPLRVVFRSAAFAGSLIGLAAVAGRPGRHPSRPYAAIAVAIVGLMMFHPNTSTAAAGVAAVALYAAIVAPVFWVPRLEVGSWTFARLVVVLWGFHTLSATFGVLQVYFPGQFQPALSTAVQGSQWGGEHLKVTLASGETVFRPMGLTDIPGGSAMAGLYAFVFGLGFLVIGRRPLHYAAGLVSLPVGLFCIYLSHVRSILVLAGILAITLVGVLLAARRFGAAARVAAAAPAVAVGAFVWAVALGGDETVRRYETLLEASPEEIYYKSRGIFLEDTITNKIPEYPFGAGLGRWGMILNYFGDPTNPTATPIWVEIQLTGWVLDGGVPLAAVYLVALFIATWAIFRIALRHPDPWLAGWAMLIVAYDVAAIAVTFNSTPFAGQAGLEFWLLNAALFAAARPPRQPVTR